MTIQTTTTEQELLNEIAEAERKVASKEAVVNDLKEQMKIAKEEYEGAVYKLREICRQQSNDADRPLLNGALSEAIEELRPKEGSGIESVTISAGGKSATLRAKNGKAKPAKKKTTAKR